MNYIGLSLISMILFGMEITISKLATTHLSAEVIALLRCIVASVVIAGYMLYTRTPFTLTTHTVYAGVAGVFLGVGFILMFNALAQGPTSVVAPLVGLSTLIPTLVGILIWQEPVTTSKVLGLLCAGAAIVLISQ